MNRASDVSSDIEQAVKKAAQFDIYVRTAKKSQTFPEQDHAFYDKFAMTAAEAGKNNNELLLGMLGSKFLEIADQDYRLGGAIPYTFRANPAALTRWLTEPERPDSPYAPLDNLKEGRVLLAADVFRVKGREIERLQHYGI